MQNRSCLVGFVTQGANRKSPLLSFFEETAGENVAVYLSTLKAEVTTVVVFVGNALSGP